jgi:hypothetical protein
MGQNEGIFAAKKLERLAADCVFQSFSGTLPAPRAGTLGMGAVWEIWRGMDKV